MKHYLQPADAVLEAVGSRVEGLTSSQAQTRLETNGPNKLAEGKKVTWLQRFADQLKNPMIIVLIAAAIVSAGTAIAAKESFADVFIILFVVVLNAVLGVLQESKAEKAIEALKEMAAATSKVLRDGKQIVVHSEDLVVGDVIILEAGDAVPADARLLECINIKAEEAALTGESVPVNKTDRVLEAKDGQDVPLGDRKNMLYMGSTIVYGRGTAVVVGTGMDTEMGKIATAISQAQEGQTPLQKKLAELSKVLTWAVLGICVFIFAFRLLAARAFSTDVMLDSFMLAVSLAVAAIPEGLAAVVTIVLSIGVTKMSKRNAIIRRLTAVETLGCTQIICSDKTGTLTQNKMTVVDHAADDETLLATAMSLCSDAEPDENGDAVGEPTECALVNYATSLSLDKPTLKQKAPRVGEAPFDSQRKMMSTVHQLSDGRIVQYTKGAPDEMLKVCTHILQQGRAVPLTEELRAQVLEQNRAFADRALRVLGAAFKLYSKLPEDFSPEAIESNLVFIGLVGMIDPVRPEVTEAIAQCRSAGIRPVMITGDHLNTAVAIAMQLGIITDASQAITGAMLDQISDEEFNERVTQYSVYARVQPEHKVRIVNAWRTRGAVTAMTGDGVNDAPSIKSADIGIGMGITGTDVTKNVADMVLADDNFATIVKAVEEGRRIYDNIRKSIHFLLASNLSEVVGIFLATLLGFTLLEPVHLLWINLITDTFPALALGMEKGERDLMQRPPRNSKSGIFSDGVGFSVVYQGILVAVLTLAAYFIGHYMEAGVWEWTNSPDGTTMAFLTLSLAEIFHSYNMRSQHGSLFGIKTHNKYLFGAMLASFLLTTAVIYVPFLKSIFGFESISLAEYAVAVLLAASVIPVVETVKFFARKARQKKADRSL
ncbi:MAG: cation-translocating P-type ATPase [Clostridia bacterium]|nr:cation-translocating P-type ATPase [Clostridia bacterium]